MRILHVCHRFLPRYVAGIEVYASALCQGLAARGHTLRVFTGDPATSAAHAYEWEGLPVEAVPWGLGAWPGPVSTFLAGFANPAVERRFARACAAFQPEIIHIHHLMGLSPALPAIGRRRGARLVITLHDYWFVCSNTWLYRWNRELCPGPGRGYYCGGCASHRLGLKPQPLLMALASPIFVARTAVLRRALLSADRLIAPSKIVARIFAGHGVPPGKIAVVPHGLSDGPAPEQDTAPRPLRFVYLGSLIPPKGAHVAVQAFNRLSDPRAQLHLYGDLMADPRYVAELRALARHPGIEFKGPVERNRVGDVLRAADVLLLPSLWYEAFSIIVDEALNAGVPVLASDHGAPAERVLPDQNGLTAPPGEVDAWHHQMQRLVDDPSLLARLRRGIAPPKRLSRHVAEIEDIYTEVLALPASPPNPRS